MPLLQTLRQKATFLDKIADTFMPTLTREEQFRLEFRLPINEKLMDDTTADISLTNGIMKSQGPQPKDNNHHINAARRPSVPSGDSQQLPLAYVYSGRVYLTPHYVIFKDTFDQTSCVMIMNISTIKRLERSPSPAYEFALLITLYSGAQLIIQFIGLRYRSEQFCKQLKINLRDNIPNAKRLPGFTETCYSEFLISKNVLRKKNITPPRAGLGQHFKYPGNPTMVREKAKLRLWFDYLKSNGRSLAIMKTNTFKRLVRIGLPNRMRGEIWELSCGALYLRFENPDEYTQLLEKYAGKSSQATEEIEKDLRRSLPEYSAYHTQDGIQRLRNVLTAYSWKNPDVGYCQAMNIVAAGLLIFMSEEQAFWCLCNLCDIYVPGYYSKTMYGTLLDQRVFEAFVEDQMPSLWDYLAERDIQLSMVSLPWFLSLFFSSMPLEYAVRIMDIFFMDGPKVLFQVALAVLRVNAIDILQTHDDGMFIAVIKNYFQTLGEPAEPDSKDPKSRTITKFQELLVTAFKEYSNITEQMIIQERRKHEKGILQSIETFVKKTQLRHMPPTNHLNSEDLSHIYDIYYLSLETYKISFGTGSSNMGLELFSQFLGKFCDWCRPIEKDKDRKYARQKAMFLKRLFVKWDTENAGELSLNDIVRGLDHLQTPDLLESIGYLFSLYDTDNDDELQKEEVLQLSEGLLFLTEPWKSGNYVDILTTKSIEKDIATKIVKENGKKIRKMNQFELPKGVIIDEEKYKIEQSERYLKAASNFLNRAFEYAKPISLSKEISLLDLSDDDDDDDDDDGKDHNNNNDDIGRSPTVKKKKKLERMKANPALDPTRPKVIDVATFRMIILADETYELFFSDTLRSSIHLDESINTNDGRNKALRSMFDGILADGRRVAEEVRRRVDSVATSRGSITSVESVTSMGGNTASIASTAKDDKYDDFDDFTTEHASEQEELLQNSLFEIEENLEAPPLRIERVPTGNSIHQPDLIEFEQ